MICTHDSFVSYLHFLSLNWSKETNIYLKSENIDWYLISSICKEQVHLIKSWIKEGSLPCLSCVLIPASLIVIDPVVWFWRNFLWSFLDFTLAIDNLNVLKDSLKGHKGNWESWQGSRGLILTKVLGKFPKGSRQKKPAYFETSV